MWTSTNFRTIKKQFDFTSSEQGRPEMTSLLVDGEDFINMVEVLNGEVQDDQIFQAIICEGCGIYRCESGNWIAIRQYDNFIFFIPAFEKLMEEQDKSEYAPPYSLRKKGAFWLSLNEFIKFKKLVPEFDRLETFKTLTKNELIALYKWDTPLKMFGDFPDFVPLKKNQILAVSEFDNTTVIDILNKKVEDLEAATEFAIGPIMDNNKIISIFLEDKSITEWKALYKENGHYSLLLGGTLSITPKEKGYT